ncbi:MAG: DUF4278 domain-containing protein [Alkalinema sp. RL_2_19]|nr:DUF4278 domain-containing protein [Alkalinema sp. RL_2_19]
MQLLYRGIAYQLNNQSGQSPSATETSPVKSATPTNVRLTYRGQTYERQPQQALATKRSNNVANVTLMYRGQTYNRQLAAFPEPQPVSADEFTFAVAS